MKHLTLSPGLLRELVDGLRAEGAACVVEVRPASDEVRLVEISADGLRDVVVPRKTSLEIALRVLNASSASDLDEVCAEPILSLLRNAQLVGLARRTATLRVEAVTRGWRRHMGQGEA